MKPDAPEAVVPLSSMQKGILFHSLYAPGTPVYRVQSVFAIEGDVDLPAFQRAWQRVVDRHQALRCSFFWEGLRTPVQAVHRHVDFAVRHVDYAALDPAEREQRLGDLMASDRRRPFDLLHPPQMRVTLVGLGDREHYLVWTRHHIILDGWSQALLLREVFRLYEVNRMGEEGTFDELSFLGPPTRLAPYDQWLREHAGNELESFWRPYLKGFTEMVDITSRPPHTRAGPARQAEAGRDLGARHAGHLAELGRRWAVTTSTLFASAWALLLSSLTGRRDILFGLTLSGRPAGLPDVERMIGVFINTLPMRVDVVASASLQMLAQTVQEHLGALTQRQHTALVDAQAVSEIPSPGRLLGSALVVGNYPTEFRRWQHQSSLAVRAVRGDVQNSFPITVRTMPGPTTRLALLYDESAFDRAYVDRLLDAFVSLLASFGNGGDRTVAALLDEVSHGWTRGPRAQLDRERPAPAVWGPTPGPRYVPPRTPVERTIAHVWTDLLGRSQVGLHDDFFAIGGHSLLAIQCVARLRAIFQTELPLQRIFDAPVLADLASALVESEGGRAGRAAEIYLEIEAMPSELVEAELERLADEHG